MTFQNFKFTFLKIMANYKVTKRAIMLDDKRLAFIKERGFFSEEEIEKLPSDCGKTLFWEVDGNTFGIRSGHSYETTVDLISKVKITEEEWLKLMEEEVFCPGMETAITDSDNTLFSSRDIFHKVKDFPEIKYKYAEKK